MPTPKQQHHAPGVEPAPPPLHSPAGVTMVIPPSPAEVQTAVNELKDGAVLALIRQLDQQKANLVAQAREELLTKARVAVSELNELGFHFAVIEQGQKPERPQSRKRQIADKPCSVCNFKTSPPHDARRHRGQPKQKPFGEKELVELGMVKVQ